MKKILINLLLSCASLVCVLLFFEFVVFRIVLPASDQPTATYENDVVRLTPKQRGTFRVLDEIAAEYRINEQGWNSGYASYATNRVPGTTRIAIIGDSYVEGLRVDHDKSLAEDLEAKLGKGHEVFRFGISGAPLSQYLHMLRREVMTYSPDIVAVLLVHNDFNESYAFKAGTRTSSFLKLHVDNGEVTGEFPPSGLPWHWYDPIRESATWRYLAIRRGLRFDALRRLILDTDDTASKQANMQANIDTTAFQSNDDDPLRDDRAVTRYVLTEMQKLTNASGAKLIVLMDGVRALIETDSLAVMDYTRGALRLNKMVRRVTGELHIPFLDLHPVFVADFGQHQQPFAFPHDGHWNEHANALASDALQEALLAHGLLP